MREIQVTPHDIQDFIAALERALSIVDAHVDCEAILGPDARAELTDCSRTKKVQPVTMTALRELVRDLEGEVKAYGDYRHVPASQPTNVRNDMYVTSVQEGYTDNNSLANVVGFDGPRGLYEDLPSGRVPALAVIAPNQCNDQHGRGNADAFCAIDYGQNNSGYTYGTQVGLNPGLIQQCDTTIEGLVEAIHSSPAWHSGHNAIVIVWDENNYNGSATPTSGLFPTQSQNRVVLTLETSFRHAHGSQSGGTTTASNC